MVSAAELVEGVFAASPPRAAFSVVCFLSNTRICLVMSCIPSFMKRMRRSGLVAVLAALATVAAAITTTPPPIHAHAFADMRARATENKPFNVSQYMVPMRDGVELVSVLRCGDGVRGASSLELAAVVAVVCRRICEVLLEAR